MALEVELQLEHQSLGQTTHLLQQACLPLASGRIPMVMLTAHTILCHAVIPSGFTFTCLNALVLDNAGNVPLAFNGLESLQAVQADGSPCNATSLAPVASMTCSFVWTVSQPEAEAGSGLVSLEVPARDASSADAQVTSYSVSSPLAVPQHPAMTVTFEHLSAGPHNSNGKSTVQPNCKERHTDNPSLVHSSAH